jgi:hypothetical protein
VYRFEPRICRPPISPSPVEVRVQPSNIRIEEKRYWDTLMQSAKIGPGNQGGMSRLALSASDKEMRDLFVRWCKDAGCIVSVDQMGSIFARRPGSDDSLPPVLVGSHLDTQIHGGPFDGCAGVLAGLEVLRTLNDHGVQTKRPIEIVTPLAGELLSFASTNERLPIAEGTNARPVPATEAEQVAGASRWRSGANASPMELERLDR